MSDRRRAFHLYAGRLQNIPDGIDYSFIPSHHKYLLIYTDADMTGKRFVMQDEEQVGLLNREEREWLRRCKDDINSKYLRENEEDISEALIQRLASIEDDLRMQKEGRRGTDDSARN